MIKGQRLEKTIESFEFEHPEIKIIRNYSGDVVRIIFSPEVTETSYILFGKIIKIHYLYKGVYVNFSNI